VAQILQLQKSLPTEKDYDRYKASGSNWTGTSYELNEDYVQNKKLTAVTNSQRKEITEGLRKSIARLEQQNRTLQSKGAPAEEIQKNEALIAERKKQLAVALAPVETPTKQIGGKEAADLDKALNTAIADLKDEFTTLFSRYHTLVRELSSLNRKKDYLAAAKAKAKANP
jgi:cell division protein FtsB